MTCQDEPVAMLPGFTFCRAPIKMDLPHHIKTSWRGGIPGTQKFYKSLNTNNMQLKTTTLAILLLALLNGGSASKAAFLQELTKKQTERATKTTGEKPVTAPPSTAAGTKVTPAPQPKMLKPPPGATPIVPLTAPKPSTSGGRGKVGQLAQTLKIPMLGPQRVGGQLETPTQAEERMRATTTTTPAPKPLTAKPSTSTTAPLKPPTEPKKVAPIPTAPKAPAKTVAPPKTSVAESSEAQQFGKALKALDLEAMRSIYEKGDNALKNHYGQKFVNALDAPTLVGMIKTSYDGTEWEDWVLKLVAVHATEAFFDEVLGDPGPKASLLLEFGSMSEVACKPQKFIHILKKLPQKVHWAFVHRWCRGVGQKRKV